MAPFMTLIFLLFMAMVGFVFDLYLFSRGAFGSRYVRNAKFTRPVSTGPLMNDKDEYELYVCSNAMYDYDNERSQRTHTVLIVMCAAIAIIGMVLFMLINAFA